MTQDARHKEFGSWRVKGQRKSEIQDRKSIMREALKIFLDCTNKFFH